MKIHLLFWFCTIVTAFIQTAPYEMGLIAELYFNLPTNLQDTLYPGYSGGRTLTNANIKDFFDSLFNIPNAPPGSDKETNAKNLRNMALKAITDNGGTDLSKIADDISNKVSTVSKKKTVNAALNPDMSKFSGLFTTEKVGYSQLLENVSAGLVDMALNDANAEDRIKKLAGPVYVKRLDKARTYFLKNFHKITGAAHSNLQSVFNDMDASKGNAITYGNDHNLSSSKTDEEVLKLIRDNAPHFFGDADKGHIDAVRVFNEFDESQKAMAMFNFCNS